MFGADDDHVESYFQSSQLPPQTRRLCTPPRNLIGLDDEQIKIGIRAGLTPSAGAEKDHFGSGCGSGEATTCLLNERLVSDSHRFGIVTPRAAT